VPSKSTDVTVEAGDILDRPSVRAFRTGAELLQAIAFVVTTAATAAGFVYLLLARRVVRPELTVVTVVAVVLLVVVVGGFAYYIAFLHDPDPYRILELNGLLVVRRVGEHHRYENIREQTIQAKRHNVRLVQMRSHWSGRSAEDPEVQSLVADHILLDGQSPEADGRVYRWLYLREPIGRGHRVKVGIRHVFKDDAERMKTYYRESGEETITRALRVVARFDLSDEPVRVEGVMWRGRKHSERRQAAAYIGHSRVVDPLTKTVEFVVSVPRPRRNCAYGVRWEWPA
jgi:hypothetical protein